MSFPGCTNSRPLSLDFQPKCQETRRKMCLATNTYLPFHPFGEAGMTSAVPHTWEVCHPSLVTQYIWVPTLEDQRITAKSWQLRAKVSTFPMLPALLRHLLTTTSHRMAYPQPQRAGPPPFMAGVSSEPRLTPAGLLQGIHPWSHGRTKVVTAAHMGGDKGQMRAKGDPEQPA